MRTNIYKDKIVRLFKKNHLLSIADVYKKIPDADYSTVYRNIEQLVSDNQIRKVVFDKGNIMYELNSAKNNHDHFLCTDCGDIEAVDISYEKLSVLNTREVTNVLLRGFCQKCH